MVTRRCTERRFLMRPDADTNNAFLYCLGWAAQRTGVEIVFFLAMSNHYHAGLIDREGRLPEFLETFHKLFAKHQNVLRGRWENFWVPEQTSVVELVGAEDVLDKMVYALGNPVKDHLVKHARQWPGASSLEAQLSGRELSASRPVHFFRPDGGMPDAVAFKLFRPPGFELMLDGEYLALLRERIEALERKVSQERAAGRIQVLGREQVLRQRWHDRPKTREPRRKLSPRVACKNTWRRIEALRRNKAFVVAYRAAREHLISGLRPLFPRGTYWLRRFLRVPCEGECVAVAA
jgi:hypothetical protein